MYSRNCPVCFLSFETDSPYTLVCGEACRITSAKISRSRYKKSVRGVSKNKEWQQTTVAKEMRAKHRKTPKAKATAVKRMLRLVRDNPYYRQTKNLRTSKSYKELRNKLITQFGMCAACHAENDLTIDHVVPMSLGGKHEPENLQVLCRACNSKKKQETVRYELPQVR
jgi:hypothetical protein